MAQVQNLNTASQALYNIYRCMKEANELNLFFDQIRVFSAVATTEGFWLRVHRAVQVNERQCNSKAYPIGFKFDDVIALDTDYSKYRASGIVRNVLCRYGIHILHPILKKVVKILLDRASIEGTQLTEENVRSMAAGYASLAASKLDPASQESIKRKQVPGGKTLSFDPRKKRAGKKAAVML